MTNQLIELSKLIRAIDLEKIKEAFIKFKDLKIKRTVSRVIDTLSLDDLNKALGTIETLSSSRVNKETMKTLFIFAFYSALRASEIISLEAVYWSIYFIQTARYIIRYYYDSDSDFDTRIDMIKEKLKNFPLGIQATSLRREVGMHRKGSTAKEFYEILDYLEDMNIISVQRDENNRRSKKISLKKHIITENHSEA